jgi:hypothetical protein
MPGGGDDAEAVALQVVVRAAKEGEFVLAAVAGTSIDVADCEAAATAGGRERNATAETAEISEQGEHQRSAQA